MTDTSDNIDKAAAILSALDVPYFKDISWRLFPVAEVDASDLAKDLDTVFKTGGLFERPGIDKGAFQIVPLKTMNALLVVSKWPSIMTLIGKWVKIMDHADSSGTNVFVYFVQNGSAKELADILKQVYGSPAGIKSGKVEIVRPTRKPAEAGGMSDVSGKVEIIPDETNNAIVIKASARDYALIKHVLKTLDIVPRQVLIDVIVAEIKLTGSVEYGVEWYLQGRTSGYTVQGALDGGVGRPINTPLGSANGFTYAVYNPVDFMRGLIHALGEDSDVDVLSSPNILAVDNKEASIEVGEDLPSVTGQITDATSGTTITNTVQYVKTGILLKVTPHINSGGLVKMEISQEVSDTGTFNNVLQSWSIVSRKANTSLVAKDGQTIIIGGLIKSKKTNSESGVPFLRNIPILGYLFGGGRKEAEKTELILLITPHVITSRTQADAITKEFSARVQDLKRMIKEGKNK
jgi:general secretion pathway protein D